MRGLGHPLVQRNSCTTWIGPAMGVELVELLSGHPQLQDRKLALGGRTGGRAVGGGYSRAVRAAPGSALSPALSLHSTGTEPTGERRRRRTRRGTDIRPRPARKRRSGTCASTGSPSPGTRPPGPCRQVPPKPSRPSSGKQANPRAQSPRTERRRKPPAARRWRKPAPG